MFAQTYDIYTKALELPRLGKIELIKLLYFSLDASDVKKHIGEIWAEEIENRISAFDQGKMQTVSATDVFARVDRARYGR
ncbi:MAG: addiction module protein [Chloroflexota bacterium]